MRKIYLIRLLLCLILCFPFFNVSGQLDVSASVQEGCAPLVVNFSPQASGAVSWAWRLGNGNTSNLQFPGLVYTEAGTYTIELIVVYDNGIRDTVVKQDFIEVFANPEANIGVGQTQICVGETLSFRNETTLGSAPLSSIVWDFGNGATSTDPNPNFTFTTPGIFDISLNVEDENGCSDFIVESQLVIVEDAPDAGFDFVATPSCDPPIEVQFTSVEPNVNHFWDFGDGTTSTEANPLHSFGTLEVFEVVHIVSVVGGCSDTARVFQSFTGATQVPVITTSASQVCAGTEIQFGVDGGPNAQYEWDFGDGNTQNGLQQPLHAFANAGTYSVTVQVGIPGTCPVLSRTEIEVLEGPQALFTTLDTAACEPPYTANFTNNSTGATRWEWTFGDGDVSNEENPPHTFTDFGQYQVQLVVENNLGCRDTLIRENLVEILQAEAQMIASPTEGCAPLDVNFSDMSRTAAAVVSWEWDLGNGNMSSNARPSQTFTQRGIYGVGLVIEDAAGCRDTVREDEFVFVGDKPQASFQADRTRACLDQTINFQNTSQSTSGIFTCLWDFGDGNTSTSCAPMHAYLDTGFFNVTLIVSDQGCKDSLTQQDFIYAQPPKAIFSADPPNACAFPVTITFTDESLGADEWFWDFGDGTFSTEQNPIHTYTDSGSYEITLTVRNRETGCEHLTQRELGVQPVTAQFVGDNLEGCIPLISPFKNESIGATQFYWDFGDGLVSTEENPIHRYTLPGIHDVKLIASNRLGCIDSLIIPQMANVRGARVVFDGTPKDGCAPMPVIFTPEILSQTTPIASYEWDFGDGGTGNEEEPLHVYDTAGSYTVTLITTDVEGCEFTYTRTNFINPTFPDPSFIIESPFNCTDNPMRFTNTSAGEGLSYLWEFGDGNTSTLTNPSHVYQNLGNYTVSLTVTDINGCDTTVRRDNLVTIQPLGVSFIADTTEAGCPPLLVNFTPVTNVQDITAWNWNFGDGATGDQTFASHLYTRPGLFNVSLEITTSSGCKDTALIPNFIKLDGPSGSFEFDPKEICQGEQVNFQAITSEAIRFQWDMGDGALIDGERVTYTYQDSGSFFPILLLEDKDGCKVAIPSLEELIVHPLPRPNFVTDLEVVCGVGAVTFVDQSSSSEVINQWQWDLGDGTGSTLQNPVHSYAQLGSYDVELVVATEFGCTDSITIPAAIRSVEGPEAVIDVSQETGCVAFSPVFSDNSIRGDGIINAWQWDFGHLGDTANTASATYTYDSAATYTVTLIISDDNNCRDTVGRSVIALPLPVPDFGVSDSFGCAPVQLQFQDRTPGAVRWDWDLGDGNTSMQEAPVHEYLQDGVYSVQLQVWDSNGCTDTLVKENYINLDHPEANFTLSDTITCPETLVFFEDVSVSDTLLTNWQWDFGDGNTGTGASVSHAYVADGNYAVQLVVSDVFGCTDTLTRINRVEVLVNVVPVSRPIQWVSVRNDQEIALQFHRYESTLDLEDFGFYEIYRQDASGQYTLIDQINNIADTLYIDSSVDTRTQSYCYKVRVVNYCGLSMELDDLEEHCSVELTAIPGQDEIQLVWTPYVGWPAVQEYNIYRVGGYQDAGQLLATVPGNTQTYLDKEMDCYTAFTYRIEAIRANSEDISLSDTATMAPMHDPPSLALDMRRATVENDSLVLLEWELPPDPEMFGLVSFVLQRDAGGGFRDLLREEVASAPGSYVDTEVEVGRQSYQYRIFGVDTCGDFTQLGHVATSIWLQAEQGGTRVRLTWTPYEEWPLGVARYVIEYREEASGQFISAGEVTGDQSEMVMEVPELQQARICYRITAYEAGGYQQLSRSNLACIQVEPILFTPSAFSPNGDDINERFVLQGLFIDQFQLQVYNRWGKMVFQTQMIEEGWDGRTSTGKDAQEGVYTFFAKGIGHDGRKREVSGTITLIR